MSCILSSLLGSDELSQIPTGIQEKLETEFNAKTALIDSSKCEVERVVADYEQKCYEMDKKMIEMSSRLDTEAANCATATSRCQELEKETQDVRAKSSGLEMSFAESQGEIAALKHTRDLWKDEKLSMQHLLEKRELEINQLKEEWKTVSEKLSDAITSKNKAELKLDEIENSGVTVEYHNKRLERENEILKEQNRQLSDEVASRSSEFNAAKLQKDSQLVSLKGRIEVKMEECRQLLAKNENLESTAEELKKKIGSLLEKIQSAEEEHRSMEELYRSELQSQVKLSELYSASAKDEEEKSGQLASAVQELQKLVTQSEEANKQLQAELNQAEAKGTELIKEVEVAKKELEKANDLLTSSKGKSLPNLSEEDLASLSPAAAMASKFIKSGMTLTEIYSKYVEAVDDLDVSKQENQRLNGAMDAILEELNEKAPILKQQREDYERALATIVQLTSQMDEAAIECQRLRAEADDATRKMGRVERENKRLELETKDLSKQLHYLLKQLEESRGRQVSGSPGRGAYEDSNVTSSSEVISGHLVTFGSIEELQEQNQKLLRVIRELTDEKERAEEDRRDEENKHLKESLDQVNEELEKLREDRDRQIELVEAIVRQRDMYRVLLSQDSTDIPMSVISSPQHLVESMRAKGRGDAPTKRKSLESQEQTSNALQVLKTEYTEYKKEVQDNNKLMNEQIESLRQKVAELHADNAKLQARVEFSAEKYDVLNQSFENIRKESNMHHEKNTKLLILIQKHEHSLSNATAELSQSQQQKAKISAMLDAAKTEIDILKRSEDRLHSENSSLKRDQQGQSVLLTNLQKIQHTMEKQDFEVRSQLRSRLESQEQELKTLRCNYNENMQQKQLSLQVNEKQLASLQQNLEKIQAEKENAVNELRNVKSELEVAKMDKQNSDLKLGSLEQRLSRLASNKPVDVSSTENDESENLKTVIDRCGTLEDEVQSLKLKLDKATKAVEQYKAVATAVEESLSQANISNKELSEALEIKLKKSSEQQTKLEHTIAKLEEENRQLNSNKTSLIVEVDHRTADLNKQLLSLKMELDHSLQGEKEARKNEQDARKQLSDQTGLLNEAQGKYQREMLLHAESVKELMDSKEKLSKHQTELEVAQNEAQSAKHLFDSNKGVWEKEKSKLMEENGDVKQRNEDMNEQIALMHSQIETMSNKMLSLQQKQDTSPLSLFGKSVSRVGAKDTSAENMEDKSSEQLMDIVKFLRKEKNLFEMKYEVAESESNRLKQQALHCQKQLDETKRLLQEEQHKSQASSSELSKHESLMKKVETLNVLSDSNRMLRGEKTRLQEELEGTKTELAETKQKLTPLQTENIQMNSQINTLKSEKTVLEQDVKRWQQRSQQLIQSPRRQDPENYRQLMSEKQKLQKNVEQVNKELTEKKLEVSNLQGEIRGLNQQNDSMKTEMGELKNKVTGLTDEVNAKKQEVEEKNKITMQIRRVGRRYKTQFEELQKKHEEVIASHSAEQEKRQDAKTDTELAENAAKLSALEASLTKANKEKEEISQKLELKEREVESMKSEMEQVKQKSEEENKVSSSEMVEENQKLVNEREELRKQLSDKEDKSKRLLNLAKNRIEQMRKEKTEMASERDRLQSEETKWKEEVERLKETMKMETERKNELNSRVEELQRQLSSVSSQQQQQNKAHPIHHHAGTSGTLELRKAANIRPISTQRVSQVSPMRVTRTARVMPEPQQEAQEGSSSEGMSARSSPHTQVAPSSTHTVSSINVNTSSQPTRAFVHPINPTSTRQQHVVSSMPTSSATHQVPSRSDIQMSEVSVRSTTSAADSAPQESLTPAIASTSANPTTSEVSESDQAIVSSSDDQPVSLEESPQQSGHSPESSTPQTFVTATVTESEAPSQSSASSSSAASSGTSGMLLLSRQPHVSHKRTYEDVEEPTGTEEIPASSSDAQVMPSAPVPKRQRSSPDQSSAVAHPVTSQAHTSRQIHENKTRVEQAESSDLDMISGIENESEKNVQSLDLHQEPEDGVDTSTFVPIPEVEANSSGIVQLSSTTDVIVLSSDESDAAGSNQDVEQGEEDIYHEDEDSAEIMVEQELQEGGDAEMQELVDPIPTTSSRPILVLQPTPPEFIARNRPPIRPAPLTPGLVPPSTDDGDGIVPCTPTLPTRRHDDTYQTINSPHVPPGGPPPIRFRFEDSFQSQPGGIGSVDNTLMFFSGATEESSRSVPTFPAAPLPSITTITQTILEGSEVPSSEVSAVSSSITEQDDVGEEDKEEEESEMCVPISSSVGDDTSSRESSETRETTTNLKSIRGRRIKLIGARPRGKGGNSPSTSSQ